MTELERLRRALRNITRIRTGNDEWDEASKFHLSQRIAERALDPELGKRTHVENMALLKADKRRACELRKHASRGNDCYLVHGAGQWARVRVMNHGCRSPDLLEVKIIEVWSDAPWWSPAPGSRMTVNITHLYETFHAMAESNRITRPCWIDVIQLLKPASDDYDLLVELEAAIVHQFVRHRRTPATATHAELIAAYAEWWLRERGKHYDASVQLVTGPLLVNGRVIIQVRPVARDLRVVR